MEEAQEDHQRVPRAGHAAAHARPASVSVSRRRGRRRHGRQPVLFPRQRHPLGGGRHAGRVTATAAAGSGQAASHGAVAVPVQPGGRAAAQLHGPVQQPGGLQRRGAAVASLPARLPRHGARLPPRPQQRLRLAPALQLPGQQRRVAGHEHRLPPPQGARAHSLHELHLMQPRPARSAPGAAPRAAPRSFGARPGSRSLPGPLPRRPAPSPPGLSHLSFCSLLSRSLSRAHPKPQPARPPLRLISLAPVPSPRPLSSSSRLA